MRLINADELENRKFNCLITPMHLDLDAWRSGWNEAIETIMDAPTIEAIPVDWIRHFLALLEDHGDEMAKISMAVIMALIVTWREEQGTENIEDNGKN